MIYDKLVEILEDFLSIQAQDLSQDTSFKDDLALDSLDLYELVALRAISQKLIRRIHQNYRLIVSINSALIVLGVAGIVQPTTSALLHNTSTIAISMKGMSGWKTETPRGAEKENNNV